MNIELTFWGLYQILVAEEMLRRLISLLSAREWSGDMTAKQRWR
jgi:hypothetical protein